MQAMRSEKKRALTKSLNKGIERAGKFLGKRNPGTLLAISGAVAGVMSLLKAGEAQAGTLQWDGNALTSGVSDAASAWNTANNWWNGSALANTNWADNSDVQFGTGTLGNAGNVSISGANPTVNSITFNAPFGTGNFNITGGTVNLLNTSTDITVNGGSPTITSALAGTGSGLNKKGTGQLNLNGTISYTGATTITAGTLRVNSSANTLYSSTSEFFMSGGSLIVFANSKQNITKNFTFSSNNAGANITTFDGVANLGHTLSGTMTINSGAVMSIRPRNTNAGATIINFDITGKITGAGDFAMAGNGSDLATAAAKVSNTSNDYSGSTTIAGTRLVLGNSGVIPDGSTVSMNLASTIIPSLDLNGKNETIAGLNGVSGAVIFNNSGSGTSTLTVGSSNATASYAGVIQDINGTAGGIVALTKTGTGTQTLSGANTYTGTTTVSAGTLKAGAANTLSSGSDVTVANTATLDVSGHANTVKSLNMISGSTLKLGMGQLLTSSGDTALNGTIDVSGSATLGKYQLISSTNAITGSFTQGSIPAQYTLLNLSANSLDLQHNAVAAMSLTPSVSRVMAGRTGISFGGTLSNTAPLDSATLSVGTLSTAGQLTASGIGADLSTLTAQGTAANLSGTFSAGTSTGTRTLAVSNSTGGSASTNIDVFSPAQLLGSGSGYGSVGSATITKTGEPANYTLGNVAVADGDATKNQGFASFTVSPAAALVSPAYILIDLTGDQTNSTASLTSNLVAALTAAGLDATDVQSDFDGLLGKYQTLHTYDVAISYTPINSTSFQFEYDFTQVSGFGSGTNYVTNVAAVPEPGSLGLLGMGALALMGSRRRKQKKTAGETALSRFYARRKIA